MKHQQRVWYEVFATKSKTLWAEFVVPAQLISGPLTDEAAKRLTQVIIEESDLFTRSVDRPIRTDNYLKQP